jgi:hypothetical protein
MEGEGCGERIGDHVERKGGGRGRPSLTSRDVKRPLPPASLRHGPSRVLLSSFQSAPASRTDMDSRDRLDIRGGSRAGTNGRKSPEEDASTKELHASGPYYYEEEPLRDPWYNPRYWRKRTWIVLGVAAVIVIAIAVPVGITVDRARNRYPNYSKLNYALAETCECSHQE